MVGDNALVGGSGQEAVPQFTTNFGGAKKWLKRLLALLSFRYLLARQPRRRL